MNFSKLIHWKLFVAAGFAGFQLDILTHEWFLKVKVPSGHVDLI